MQPISQPITTYEQIDTPVGELAVARIGHGPAVLLWHSMMVDSKQWSRVTGDLATDHTLILANGPGHGRSGTPPVGYTLEDCADAAITILDRFGLDRPHWLGSAWGGHVGLVAADRHPGRLRSVVAIASPVTPLKTMERRQTQLLAMVYSRFGAILPLRTAIADALLTSDSRRSDPQARSIVMGGFARPERAGLTRSIRAMMLNRPGIEDLPPRELPEPPRAVALWHICGTP